MDEFTKECLRAEFAAEAARDEYETAREFKAIEAEHNMHIARNEELHSHLDAETSAAIKSLHIHVYDVDQHLCNLDYQDAYDDGLPF